MDGMHRASQSGTLKELDRSVSGTDWAASDDFFSDSKRSRDSSKELSRSDIPVINVLASVAELDVEEG
uniref:Uncharacterized protein n=1 Tax=Anguilla anguilla TaxID=7936 RepID=A0A0E9SQ63_ANGAN